VRTRLPTDDPGLADVLAVLTSTLLTQEKFAESEPVARECLTIREKRLPDAWRTSYARDMLGTSLLGIRFRATWQVIAVTPNPTPRDVGGFLDWTILP